MTVAIAGREQATALVQLSAARVPAAGAALAMQVAKSAREGPAAFWMKVLGLRVRAELLTRVEAAVRALSAEMAETATAEVAATAEAAQ